MKYGIPGGFGNLTGRTSERAETMGSEQMNREKAESWLKIGLFGALLTLIWIAGAAMAAGIIMLL